MSVKYTSFDKEIMQEIREVMYLIADACSKNTEAVVKRGFTDFPKPPILTGTLRRNITSKVVFQDNNQVVGEVRASTPLLVGAEQKPKKKGKRRKKQANIGGVGGREVEYAKFVEFGTVKMQARPFLRQGAINALPSNERIIKRILKSRTGKK